MKRITEIIKTERDFDRKIKDAFSGKIKPKKGIIKVFKFGDTRIEVF